MSNEPIKDQTKDRTRYSDEELEEFRVLIQSKLDSAKSELAYLQEQISNADNAANDTYNKFNSIEDGVDSMEKEYLTQMASRQIQFIKHLENALVRIQNKTYGICRQTGKLISKERLRAVPHATLSMEAKMGKENK
jgi:RNA polymerase-binding transcription factor DksA